MRRRGCGRRAWLAASRSRPRPAAKATGAHSYVSHASGFVIEGERAQMSELSLRRIGRSPQTRYLPLHLHHHAEARGDSQQGAEGDRHGDNECERYVTTAEIIKKQHRLSIE